MDFPNPEMPTIVKQPSTKTHTHTHTLSEVTSCGILWPTLGARTRISAGAQRQRREAPQGAARHGLGAQRAASSDASWRLLASLFLVASLLLVVRPGAPSSFLLLLVRHLLLEAMHLFLVANLAPFVVRPGAPFVASDRSVRSDP